MYGTPEVPLVKISRQQKTWTCWKKRTWWLSHLLWVFLEAVEIQMEVQISRKFEFCLKRSLLNKSKINTIERKKWEPLSRWSLLAVPWNNLSDIGKIRLCYSFISSICESNTFPSLPDHLHPTRLSISLSSLPSTRVIPGVGCGSDTLWCAPQRLRPLDEPSFNEPNPPEVLQLSPFHSSCSACAIRRCRAIDQGWTAVHHDLDTQRRTFLFCSLHLISPKSSE